MNLQELKRKSPADLLIFDDLSSALDVDTESTLWQRVFDHHDATVLAVSHRRAALRRVRSRGVTGG